MHHHQQNLKLDFLCVLLFILFILHLCSHMNNNSFNGQLPPKLSNLSNLLHLWVLKPFFLTIRLRFIALVASWDASPNWPFVQIFLVSACWHDFAGFWTTITYLAIFHQNSPCYAIWRYCMLCSTFSTLVAYINYFVIYITLLTCICLICGGGLVIMLKLCSDMMSQSSHDVQIWILAIVFDVHIILFPLQATW